MKRRLMLLPTLRRHGNGNVNARCRSALGARWPPDALNDRSHEVRRRASAINVRPRDARSPRDGPCHTAVDPFLRGRDIDRRPRDPCIDALAPYSPDDEPWL